MCRVIDISVELTSLMHPAARQGDHLPGAVVHPAGWAGAPGGR